MSNRGAGKLVFTFPGQGSFHASILSELYARDAYRAHFESADRIAKRILGHRFLPVLQGTPAEQAEALKAFPDLDQVGIFVTEFLIADALMMNGVQPDLLLGHSFGEIAALAVGGAFSFETGMKIVCQRVLALAPLNGAGQMGALSCGASAAEKLLESLGTETLQLAVLNHDRQSVISGSAAELAGLAAAAATRGINLTVLKSRFPFHSSLLFPAVQPFRNSLCSYNFRSASISVFLGTENRLYAPDCDLADVLAAQFIRRLDFAGILRTLSDSGYRAFVECGAGDIVTGIVGKALASVSSLVCLASARPGEGLAKGIEAIRARVEPSVHASGPIENARVSTLLQDVEEVLERTAGVLRKFAPAEPAPAKAPVQKAIVPTDAPAESLQHEPIAIVAMGCVLPGARDPEQYWHNLIHGVSGIVDLAREDASIAADFRSGDGSGEVKIVPDKTYTLLHGSVGEIRYDARLLGASVSEAKFQTLSRAEKLLALATAQSLETSREGLARIEPGRVQFILGATGDGCGEYDEALFLENVEERLPGIEPDAARRAAFSKLLRKSWDAGDAAEPPTSRYQQIVECLLGQSLPGQAPRMYVVDAACSSSLYAVNLGMKALENHTADVVFAGGVFAPGPANNTLFAQFRGLTPTASRPLDAAADGVVFGDGAGVLVLKRLTDAVAAQDRILGVIRGMGISSDGKSPAINVPQSKGQSLAIRRAYERSGIDASTIQYVEAHATGTPVGDAVEFSALREALPQGGGKIPLGSVKSLIGHTGWAAGVASIIKLIQSFAARTLPPQHNFKSASPEIPLDASQFTIATAPQPWPTNASGLPMRAAINGFGFGGTNAHLLLESYDAAYHARLCGRVSPRKPAQLAMISFASMFPGAGQLISDSPSADAGFSRKLLALPKGKMLLPDVREHMDASQYLAALGAERVLAPFASRLPELRSQIGVVLGVEAKTQRGVDANQRIFLDRLKRRVKEAGADRDLLRLADQVEQTIQAGVIPSGPYTLPGLMPNVVAGRVAHMFDLHGPNIVIDMGTNSAFQCLAAAAEFLEHKECKIVLAGGINAARTRAEHHEGAFLMALTTVETAKELDLPIECLVSIASGDAPARAAESSRYRGASGIVELAEAVAAAREGRVGRSVREAANVSGQRLTVTFGDGVETPAAAPTSTSPFASTSTPAPAGTPYAYVQGTPIHYFTPALVPSEIPAAAAEGLLRSRKILFLTDQPERWLQLELSGALAGLHFQVLCTRCAGLSRSIEVNLESEEKLPATLERLAGSFDTVIPVMSLEDSSATSLLAPGAPRTPAVLDMLFAVCRSSYAAIAERKIWVASLCLNAFRGENLDPHTGLAAGFLKALARELPDSVSRVVNTDETNPHTALRQLEAELARESTSPDVAEICYRGGKRHSIALAPVSDLAQGDRPVLTAESVVVATGGGRGVTAVLAEELITRFGCTVVALGRTDPAAAPANMLAMDEAQLAAYEPQFYKERIAQGGKKITELKREFGSYQAAHEVSQTIRQLSALGGRFEYISTDLTNPGAVAKAMDTIYRKYGRVDMVLHGAGTQVSKVLPKKSLRDFQGVVAAKLESLRLIHHACHRHAPGKPVDYHILTSAFSYMGNDGQEDYGAANETLNRLAAVMTGAGHHNQWLSVAWLGWAGIGMTRGSEYAALAASRRLRGITKEEGQKIFAELLRGRAAAPINILLASGEIDFYKVAMAPIGKPSPAVAPAAAPAPARRNSLTTERVVSSETAPYVWDHLVDGIPTLPGAFLIMLIAEAALELRPGMKVRAFEDASFKRFVRMRREGLTPLRFVSQVVTEDERSTLIRVAIVADFIHKNGTVLQKDVEQTVISVRLGASVATPPLKPLAIAARGQLLEDPYLMESSPVHLNGPFKAMKNIMADEAERFAEYKLREGAAASRTGYQYLLPNLILMDALWRFGAIHRDREGFPIYVPEACKSMKVYYDFSHPDEKLLTGKLTFSGANPHLEDDRLLIGPVEAKDPAGATLLLVDGGLCRKLGHAFHAKERHAG